MVTKNISLVIVAVFLISFLSLNVLASGITASIGNSRMVLRLETGETIEKYILVRNVNDQKVTVDLSSTGELADRVKIKDESFELEPGEEKNAYFTISARDEGTTETKINVKFTPKEGNGVGLTSTVIVIASGEPVMDEDVVKDLSDQENENGGFLGIGKKASTSEEDKGSSISTDKVMLISTIVLVLVLGGLYFYSQNKGSKKKVGRKVEE